MRLWQMEGQVEVDDYFSVLVRNSGMLGIRSSKGDGLSCMGVDTICNVGGGLDDHCARSAR
jgi:hypothetical protein